MQVSLLMPIFCFSSYLYKCGPTFRHLSIAYVQATPSLEWVVAFLLYLQYVLVIWFLLFVLFSSRLRAWRDLTALTPSPPSPPLLPPPRRRLRLLVANPLVMVTQTILPPVSRALVRARAPGAGRSGVSSTVLNRTVMRVWLASCYVMLIVLPCSTVVVLNDGCAQNWKLLWLPCAENGLEVMSFRSR